MNFARSFIVIVSVKNLERVLNNVGKNPELSVEALLGVIGIRDIWVKNYRDTGYLGGKLKGYGIFLKRFWDIEDRSYHFLKESNKFISQYRRRK